MDYNIKYFLKMGKESISIGSKPRFKMVYNDIEQYIQNENKNIDLEYIFTQLFNNACLHSQQDIISLLITIYFEHINSISQLALRQNFFYGKHIIKNKQVKCWYNDYVLPLFTL